MPIVQVNEIQRETFKFPTEIQYLHHDDDRYKKMISTVPEFIDPLNDFISRHDAKGTIWYFPMGQYYGVRMVFFECLEDAEAWESEVILLFLSENDYTPRKWY